MRLSGYDKKLSYKPTDTTQKKHILHNRKIIALNPPFRIIVSNKIRKYFKPDRSRFPKDPHLQQHIQCKQNQGKEQDMQNKKSIINNHNMKYLNNTGKIKENCICRNKTSFKWKRSTAKHYLISKNYFKPAQIRK